jgi:rhamnosyltransferase
MTNLSVAAVTVTFNPVLSDLRDFITRVIPQVGQLVIVDNGSTLDVEQALPASTDSVHIIKLPQNQGLAAAQNVGIEWAMSAGAQHLIFFDQDSNPKEDMVATLLNGLHTLEKQGIAVGAVGPYFLDVRKFPDVDEVNLSSVAQSNLSQQTLIASGSLISLKVLEQVGPMVQELFIDYVDLEWCLRANALGYEHFKIADAYMTHAIGGEPIQFLGKFWPSHNPVRHYFMFRNAIWLYKKTWVPIRWKLIDGLKLIRKFIFYALFAKPRWEHIRMMGRGIWHGLIGRMGPFN